MLTNEIAHILEQLRQIQANPSADYALPQNSFYLHDGKVVCFDRETGESRHPYDADGLVVWARSSGYIEACESTFSIFKPVHFCDDPSVAFFAGLPTGKGEFFPLSLLGVCRQLFEPDHVRRCTVYSPRAAYYITQTDSATFVVRVHVSQDKHIHFAVYAHNETAQPMQLYLSSYMETLLQFREYERFWDRMHKFGQRLTNNACILRFDDHCLTINQSVIGGNIAGQFHTVSRADILGPKGRTLGNAQSLRTGCYQTQATCANTTEIPTAGDIYHVNLAAGEAIRIEYDLSYYHNQADAMQAASNSVCVEQIDKALAAWEASEAAELDRMTITFDDWKGSINPKVLNRFVRNLQKQTSFCALGKNYAGSLIGIRDVFQQLEGSLIWQPEKSREKIVTALNYILEDGRPPRQFSLPASPEIIPEMDMREFIDQGVWIISTIYTYLCYTDDWSILKEECSYYVASTDNVPIAKSTIRDNVLAHMLKIMAFLSRNLDREYGTNCLRALYGDWNDALDGLGKTTDPDKKYGSGVTVMATLQFYQNCREMTEILQKLGGYPQLIEEYALYMRQIEEGLKKHAVQMNDAGLRRIVHGWGDKLSYKLGSFHDPDGADRCSSTSNAFWAISGMIRKDTTLKDAIMDAMNRLQGKYGLLTFDVPFPYGMAEAGSVANITPGTYENCCVYVHASTFCVMALFTLGESQMAWQQLEKLMVISHDNCTMTTFVMPNSYCYNPDFGMDGGSMGDWYTGSGAVLVKELIKYGFGICPTLDGLTVQTPATMPCNNASIQVIVKGHPITLIYRNEGNGKRSFRVNGTCESGTYDALMNTQILQLSTAQLDDRLIIEVID